MEHLLIRHAPWSVVLVVLVCLGSAYTAFRLLQHARAKSGSRRWALLAAIAFAVGSWSTQLIAMLGYKPGLPIGLDPLPIASSLGVMGLAAIPTLLTCVATRRVPLLVAAGGFLGLGLAAMHYTGMAGVLLPGSIVWDAPLVVLSVAGGVLLTAVALPVFRLRSGRGSRLVPATILAAAMTWLHFAGMAAVTHEPAGAGSAPAGDVPRLALALAVAAALAIVLGLAVIALLNQRLAVLNLQLRQRDRALRTRTEQFHSALNNMTQGLAMYDRNDRLIVSNRRYVELTGVDPEIMRPGRRFRRVLEANKAIGNFPGKEVDEILQERAILRKKGTSTSFTQKLANGRVIDLHFEPMPGGGWIATYSDITEQEKAKNRIRHMASHDELTGLSNRAAFIIGLREELELAESEGLSLLFLDLDGFKEVNDTFGHLAGDELLKAVGRRLRRVMRKGDRVARLGGDEFAVMARHSGGTDGTALLADRLIDAVSAPYWLDGVAIRIGTSVGIAVAPRDGEAPRDLLKNADIALYRAKRAGRGCHRFFEPLEAEPGVPVLAGTG